MADNASRSAVASSTFGTNAVAPNAFSAAPGTSSMSDEVNTITVGQTEEIEAATANPSRPGMLVPYQAASAV